MNIVFDDGFEAAYDAGWSARETRQPLSACPYGPGLDAPEDARDERHMGWLYGWHDREMACREWVAWNDGWIAFDLDVRPFSLSSPREVEQFSEGWIAAACAEQRDYCSLH